MLINYCLNLRFYAPEAVFLFRIIINYTFLLTRISFCPYYCIVVQRQPDARLGFPCKCKCLKIVCTTYVCLHND